MQSLPLVPGSARFVGVRRPACATGLLRHKTPQASQQPEEAAKLLSSLSESEEQFPPWSFHFQHNERYLEWTDSAQEQLLKLHISEKLDLDLTEVTMRLRDLDLLLPDLVQRLPRLKADLLLKLLSNTEVTGSKLLALKSSLPRADIQNLASRFPMLLTDYSVEELVEKTDELRKHLPGVDLDDLVEREPMVFKADMTKVLADVQRLLGRNVDPVKYFATYPRQVIDMQQGGLHSSAETGADHIS
ncbi:hypothetical protein WJX74_004400 [Apatococcus lobatus]|uniref:Uncharacterized protein n=2 Tax=Apatococcus TaxID=904362 RepID=A0AAW1TDY8_9CHLO